MCVYIGGVLRFQQCLKDDDTRTIPPPPPPPPPPPLPPSQYYTKVSEAESWMNDKKPLVAHGEYGKDEDSTQALIKKQEAIELEIDGYSAKMGEVRAESQRLLSKKHFDSDIIRERQVTWNTLSKFILYTTSVLYTQIL